MKYESLIDLLKNRRTIRRFKPDPIPDEFVKKIIEAARWAPSGYNMQPWEFVVVKEEKRREFDYNPQPSVKTNEVSEEKRMVAPEIKERTLDFNPKPSARPYEATKVKKSVEPKIRPSEDVGTEKPSHSETLKSDYNPQPSVQ